MTTKIFGLVALGLVVSTQGNEKCYKNLEPGATYCYNYDYGNGKPDFDPSAEYALRDYIFAYTLPKQCIYGVWGDYMDWLVRDGKGVVNFSTTQLSVYANHDDDFPLAAHVNVVNLDVPNCYQRVDHQATGGAFSVMVDFTALMEKNSCFRNGDRVGMTFNRAASRDLSKFCAESDLLPLVATIETQTSLLRTDIRTEGSYHYVPNHGFKFDVTSKTQQMISVDKVCEITGNIVDWDPDHLTNASGFVHTIDYSTWATPVVQLQFDPIDNDISADCRNFPRTQTLYGPQSISFPLNCVGELYVTRMKTNGGAVVCNEEHHKFHIDTRTYSPNTIEMTTKGDVVSGIKVRDDKAECLSSVNAVLNVAQTPVYDASLINFHRIAQFEGSRIASIAFQRDEECSFVWKIQDTEVDGLHAIDLHSLLGPGSCLRENDVVSMQYQYSDSCKDPRYFPARVKLTTGGKVTININSPRIDWNLNQAVVYEPFLCDNFKALPVPDTLPLISRILVNTPQGFVDFASKVSKLELTDGAKCRYFFAPRKTFHLRTVDAATQSCFLESNRPVHVKIHYANSCQDRPGDILLDMIPNFKDNAEVQNLEIRLTSSDISKALDPEYKIIDM